MCQQIFLTNLLRYSLVLNNSFTHLQTKRTVLDRSTRFFITFAETSI